MKRYSRFPFYFGAILFVFSTLIRYSINPRYFFSALCMLVGAFIRGYGILNICLNRGILPKTAAFLRRCAQILVLLGAVSFVIMEAVIYTGGNTDATFTEEYALILGAGLNGEKPSLAMQSRIDAAVEYLNKNKKAYAVACGGMGSLETITEAEAIKRGLIHAGIDEERIILEDESVNTDQNIKNAARMIRVIEGNNPMNVVVITNEFHLWRGKYIARRNGFTATGYGVETPLWWLRYQLYVREYFSSLKALAGY